MIKIVFEEENKRAAAYDDNQFVGECTYSASEKIWIIDHTYVKETYGGQGIATKLVKKIVDEARNHQVKIIPLCVFAKREFKLRDEYRDVLAN